MNFVKNLFSKLKREKAAELEAEAVPTENENREVYVSDTENTPASKEKRKFGIGWRCFYAFGGLSVVLFIIMIISPSFSDFFNRHISAYVRGALALITSIFPFSLAEILLILLIPAIVGLMILAAKKYCDSWGSVWAFVGKLMSVAVFMAVTYIWGFAPGYHGSPLDQKLEIEKSAVSAEELRYTADILTMYVNAEYQNIEYGEDDFSVMPYSLSELNAKLLDAYDKVCEKYDFIPKMYSKVKPVMMSELMSYTHITGVYSFFTGEANLNVAFPDYTLPFTAAHELAHQRGIAREDEANFVAFLVCAESEDTYIRYSGYLNLLEYVTNAYYYADTSEGKAKFSELRMTLNATVKKEQSAYSCFFDKYRDSVASNVTETVNNAYLQINGTPGTVSYGMVVDLAVAYYKND